MGNKKAAGGKDGSPEAKPKKKGRLQWQLFLFFTLVSLAIFLPSAILLLIGMLPTIVAGLFDKDGGGTKVITVGGMNLAGTSPFLMQLWSGGHTIHHALAIAADPKTIIVMYSAAGIGYFLDWLMGRIVRTVKIQRATMRLKDIKKIQEGMVERWGREVTGDVPLDQYGFPLETANPAKKQP